MQVQEVKQLFFNHAKNVIFKENEARTLKGLLEDYNKMLENYNFKRCELMSLLKEMLQKEFGQSIGFHNCFQKNQSYIVLDVPKGGTYIEAASNFWRISKDDVLKNVAKTLKEKAKIFSNMEWPPHLYQLEKPYTHPEELVKILNWLKYSSSKENDLMEDPKLFLLGDILLAHISNKWTNIQVNKTVVNLKYSYTALFSLSCFNSSAFDWSTLLEMLLYFWSNVVPSS